MNKLLNYVLTHFRIKPSHPEETKTGWEIRWTFFNIAFMKRGFDAKIIREVKLQNKDQSIDAYVCISDDGELWFGYPVGNEYVFLNIDDYENRKLTITGMYLNRVLDYLISEDWCLGSKTDNGFILIKQKTNINKEMKLPERTLIWK